MRRDAPRRRWAALAVVLSAYPILEATIALPRDD
jgi:hypothetical protein